MAGEPVRFAIRRDWRLLYLVPCATFLAVLLIGMVLGPVLFMDRVPDFGTITITADPAKTRPAVGFELAARQQMVIVTFLLMVAAVLLAAFSLRTIRGVSRELASDSTKTDAARADYVLGLVLLVVGMAGAGLLASLRANYCGVPDSHHLYRCLGKGIVPDLVLQYLKNMGAEVLYLKALLDRSIDVANITVALGGACLLFALLLLPRGFDRMVTADGASAPEPIGAAELKRWLDNRTRSLNGLSMFTALVLVAGIAQMFGWMNWPLSVMTKELLEGVAEGAPDLRESYQALVGSVLQFHAVWFGLLVVALIFPTNMVLFHKCRVLAREIVERNAAIVSAQESLPEAEQEAKTIETAKAEIAAAEAIVDQANDEATFKTYFDSYRGYLLALAPAIVQQLLTLGA